MWPVIKATGASVLLLLMEVNGPPVYGFDPSCFWDALNSLVAGCGPDSGRGGLPCHLSMGWHSMNTEPRLMAAPAAERKSSALTLL